MTFIRFYPAVAWLLLSCVLLCLPGSVLPARAWLTAIYADKWVHIGMFGMLCILWCYGVYRSDLPRPRIKNSFLFIVAGCIAYGTVMEFVQQSWVANRSFEIGDIVADSAGALSGYLVAYRKWLRQVQKIGPDRNRDRNQN